MRRRVLQLLKSNRQDFLSGEKMAGELAVSRTAVWKAVQALQADGYAIEKSPRRGYRLLDIPDLLYPMELAAELQSTVVGNPVSKLNHYLTLSSTNETLKEMAEAGAPEGTVVIAEEQTRGKGRLGRSWSSPRGRGIWFSTLLKPSVSPRETPVFTLLAAVAVMRALHAALPRLAAGIKWPNDILIQGRKACGILTELKAEADRLHYLVIGIGLNVNQEAADFPPGLEGVATSLYLECGEVLKRLPLAVSMLQSLDDLYGAYRTAGFGPLLEEWKAKNITLGRRVNVSLPAGHLAGTAVEISAEGALIIQTEDGKSRHVHAGEVTLTAKE